MSGALGRLDPEGFAEAAGVSRETSVRLERYLALLIKWQKTINLVAQSSLDDPWRRHFLDSAQLAPHIGDAGIVVDLGSGAGFPGLVLAIVAPRLAVHLIESDARKAAFLIEAVRETGASAKVHCLRAESAARAVPPAEIVTARALAPLPTLLQLAVPLLRTNGACLFLKGAGVEAELTQAGKTWKMDGERFPSRSDPTGTILRLRNVARAS